MTNWNTVFGAGGDYGSDPVGGTIVGRLANSNDSFVGNMVENALFPPNLPPKMEGSGTALVPTVINVQSGYPSMTGYNAEGDSAQFYAVAGVRNTARIYSAVRAVFGTFKVTPDLCADPYKGQWGDVEELYLMMDFGYGRVELSDLKIGNTPISAYRDIDYKIWYDYTNQRPDFYRNDHVSDFYDLEIINQWIQRSVPAQWSGSIWLRVHYPQGCWVEGADGSVWPNTLRMQLEFRVDGGPWRGMNQGTRVSSSHGYTPEGSNTYKFRILRQYAFTHWLRIETFENGQIEVRIKRNTYPGYYNNPNVAYNIYDETRLTELGCVSFRPPLDLKHQHTVIEFRIFGSDKVGGMLENFSAIGKRFIDVWDGQTWTIQHSRNPAWIAVQILRGIENPNPIPDHRIDLAKFLEYANWCDEIIRQGTEYEGPRFTCDANMDSMSTVHERVTQVLSSARASLTMRGGKYSVIWEGWPTQPAQVFTPMNSWGFTGARIWTRPVDGLKVKWVDPEIGYQESEDIVYADGKDETNSQFFETIACPFATRWSQAYRDGRYHLAVGLLRPEIFTIVTDVESLVCERGDLVRVQHDVPKVGGLSSRIEKIVLEEYGPDIVEGGNVAPGDLLDPAWFTGSTGILSIQNGNIHIDRNQGDGFAGGRQLLPTTAGKTYQVNITIIDSGIAAETQVEIDDNIVMASADYSGQSIQFDFTATADGSELKILPVGSVDNTAEFNNVVCVEKINNIIGEAEITTREPFLIDGPEQWQMLIRFDDGTSELFNIQEQVDGYTVALEEIPEKAKAGDLIVWGKEGFVTDDFLVKTIVPGEELTAVLTLIPYSPEIQDSDIGDIPPYNPPISEDDLIPGCLELVEVEPVMEYVDRQPMSTVAVRWSPEPYAVYYEVYMSLDGEEYFLTGQTGAPEYLLWDRVPTFNAQYPTEQVCVKVLPVSFYGSRPAIESCDPVCFDPPHDTTPPGKVLFFAGNVTGSTMHLTWLPPQAPDLAGYVIRYSPLLEDVSWDNATTEIELVPHDIHAVEVNARVGTYMIKAYDTSGHYSLEPALVKTTIPALEDMNFVLDLEQSPTFDGVKDLCEVDGSNQLIISQKTDPEGGCESEDMGIYNFDQTIELNEVQQVYLSSKLDIIGGFCPGRDPANIGTDYDVNVQVRISTSAPIYIASWPTMAVIDPIGEGFTGGDWSGWQRLTAGYYTGRKFQFRALLTSRDGSAWPIVKTLSVQMDVKDRIVSGSNIPVDVGGTVILFDDDGGPVFFTGINFPVSLRAFADPPVVTATLDNATLGDFLTIVDVTAEGFTALIRDGSNNSIAGQIDYMARGYGYGLGEALPSTDLGEEDDIRLFPSAIIRPTTAAIEEEDYVPAFNQRFRYRP